MNKNTIWCRRQCCIVLILLCFLVVYITHNIRKRSHPIRQENEAVSSRDDLLVTIPLLGQVRGRQMESADGRLFAAFEGVPYAKPPVGEFRFKDPQPVDPWSDRVINAASPGPACNENEDCLILNIYTHNLEANRPVMVYIHGGSFIGGSGARQRPGLIMGKDVVLVTINYRLGALGFFTTGDSEAPGNYGLLDQTMALKWVQDHIRHFGGNPESVTIFGNSAGGASIVYHLLSPHSKGLFHRAIAQSGSALNPWARLEESTMGYSKMLAKDLKCEMPSSKETIACLQKSNPNEIIRQSSKSVWTFSPRVDKERESPVLPDEPRKLIEQKRFNQVPFIAGLVSLEGLMWAEEIKFDERNVLNNNIPEILGFELHENRPKIVQKIVEHFLNNTPTHDFPPIMNDVCSDYLFNKGLEDSVRLFSRYSDKPVYYYLYSYKNAIHAEENQKLFGTYAFNDPKDSMVSNMIVDLWTSFAENGFPRSEQVADSWAPLDAKSNGETRYFKIDSENPRMVNQEMPFHHRLSFWDTFSLNDNS